MVKVGCGMGQGPASEVTHLKLIQIPVCLCCGTKIVPLSLGIGVLTSQRYPEIKTWPSHRAWISSALKHIQM